MPASVQGPAFAMKAAICLWNSAPTRKNRKSAAVRFQPRLLKLAMPDVMAVETRAAPLTLSQIGTRRSAHTPSVNQNIAYRNQ